MSDIENKQQEEVTEKNGLTTCAKEKLKKLPIVH